MSLFSVTSEVGADGTSTPTGAEYALDTDTDTDTDIDTVTVTVTVNLLAERVIDADWAPDSLSGQIACTVQWSDCLAAIHWRRVWSACWR